MDYSQQEIDFVAFCAENLDCEANQERCPLFEECEQKGESNELCRQIVVKMQGGHDLTEEEKALINLFLNEKQWKKGGCQAKSARVMCINRSHCDEREASGLPSACDDLFHKLGLYQPDEYKILEAEIQKAILNDLPNMDWGIGEKLRLIDREVKIPVGRIDILLREENAGTLVIVELKPEVATREHVGQLASYVGWYKNNMPEHTKSIRGILLAKDFNEGAKYALEACPEIEPRLFELHVDIMPYGKKP